MIRLLLVLTVLASCGTGNIRYCSTAANGDRVSVLGHEMICSSYGCYKSEPPTYCQVRPTTGDRL